MSPWVYGYLAALVVMGVLDALWLGFLARDFYRQEIGDLLAEKFRLGPAAAFYFGYPAVLTTLALNPVPESAGAAAWRSALVGLVAYGTYDLTNMATLKHWSLRLALVDTAWGVLASTMAGIAAYMLMQKNS
ncbi:MAG TPA: DUF2177 family protein [Rubrivivax sp.]